MGDVEIRLKKGVSETIQVPVRADGRPVIGGDGKPVTESFTRPKTQVVPHDVAMAATTAKGAIYEIVPKAKAEKAPDPEPVVDGKALTEQVAVAVAKLLPELLEKALPAIPTPDEIVALIDAKLAQAEKPAAAPEPDAAKGADKN